MKVVVQEETTGCGLACVATLANKTYTEVQRIAQGLGIQATDSRLYSDTEYVRRLLGYLKIKAAPGETTFDSWEKLPDTALLATKYHLEGGRPFWHWVVFARRDGKAVVLDPAQAVGGHPRADFEAMNPKWFIKVEVAPR